MENSPFLLLDLQLIVKNHISTNKKMNTIDPNYIEVKMGRGILSTQVITHFKTSKNNYSAYVLSWIVHRVSKIRILNRCLIKIISKSKII
jgi:hypothetical protein